MEPIRMLKDATHFKRLGTPSSPEPSIVPCSPADPDPTKFEASLNELLEKGLNNQVVPPPITKNIFSRFWRRPSPRSVEGTWKCLKGSRRSLGRRGREGRGCGVVGGVGGGGVVRVVVGVG